MSTHLKGSCLCGNIQFEYSGKLGPITQCHCRQCRKSNGTAFAANCSIDKSRFNIVSGEDLIKEYESTKGKFRAFCNNCGSPVYSRRDYLPDKLRIRIGLLDTKIDQKPAFHIFVDSKAEWYEICDGIPSYTELEPGR
jgi:hypothetical protein